MPAHAADTTKVRVTFPEASAIAEEVRGWAVVPEIDVVRVVILDGAGTGVTHRCRAQKSSLAATSQ